MKKPILSPDFTIDDIHKLREYNYEITKHMSDQERLDYYTKAGWAFQREVDEARLQEVL